MKRAYSEFVPHPEVRTAMRIYKRTGPLWDAAEESAITNDQRVELSVNLFYYEGKCRHLFVGKSLFDWLVDRAGDIAFTADRLGKIFDLRTPRYTKESAPDLVCVHVSGGDSPCAIVHAGLCSADTPCLVVISSKGESWGVVTTQSELDAWSVKSRPAVIMARFINGLITYLSCFEGVIVAGVPYDLKHAPRFNEYASQHLVEHPDIKGDGSTISPHFRNGHFRLLTSERFTKKRGQVVFVRECFVKGHAFHVEEMNTANTNMRLEERSAAEGR